MFDNFPNKEQREWWNINQFIEKYNRKYSKNLDIFCKQERPDFVCKDNKTGEFYGVEVTEVYLSDRSVPDNHKPLFTGQKQSIEVKLDFEPYGDRIAEKIHEKIEKARNNYKAPSCLNHLKLSVYLAEHIFVRPENIDNLIDQYGKLFNSILPFDEIVFLNLVDRQTCFYKSTITTR